MKGFEIIESSSRTPVRTNDGSVTITNMSTPTKAHTKGDKALDIVSNNFDSIMNLAGSIVEIKKMKVASEACLKKMAEDRKALETEAQAYAIKKRADTSSVVDRMNVIRSMMQDFYAHNQGNLSGDDFCKIITEVVNQMGRVEDGIK